MRVRPKSEFLVFGQPEIQQDEIDDVIDSMHKGWLGTGPKVAKFEKDFSNYKEVPYVAALNSCTAALHLSLLAAGVGPGDEVITTPMTFCASVNAIIHAGATPVLVDVDPHSMNIDVKKIREKINSKTRALLPVHFAGRSCDMDEIVTIANDHQLKLIEDCAHAIETEYRGQKAGTFGDFSCFSFYATKNVSSGEGGMVVARREEDIARIKVLGLHGMSKDAWKRFGDDGYKHYQVIECGFKYNMMDLQAAIGIHQLARVEKNWLRREQIWNTYQQAFADLPITLPSPVEADTRHAYHLYTILVNEDQSGIARDQFLDTMAAENIGVGVHYLSLPEHPYYQQRFGWKSEDYPHAAAIGNSTVSIPLSPKLTDEDVEDVIAAVRRSLRC
ncbi:DegT/DnrJ/EryC1/StrS family aminotransferase [Undibacterium sp. Ji49W]|uniref:DegT/DnrJ/EryC1/StrS family aminotransferase n=1 Tax=Undibacterium sp. Ji49W TaxID=3413040 RepID=UPI003BF44BFC